VFLFQFGEGFIDFIDRSYFIQGESYNPGLFGKCLKDGLPDPPDSIGDKFKSPGFIKPLGRFDETKITFVDQVRKT